MARVKITELLKTFVVTTSTPPTSSEVARTGTISTLISRVLGDLKRIKGGTLDFHDAPPTDLVTLNAHQITTDGSDHGGHLIGLQDHNTDLPRTIRRLNLGGSGAEVSVADNIATVNISSGGGGGTDHTLLGVYHTDTNASDTPTENDTLVRVAGVWEASHITHNNVATANVDGADATPSMRRLGTAAGQALPGNYSGLHNRKHNFFDPADHQDVKEGLTLTDGAKPVYNLIEGKWGFKRHTTSPHTFFASGDLNAKTGVGHDPVEEAEGKIAINILATLDTAPVGDSLTATVYREAGGPGGTATQVGAVTFAIGVRSVTNTGLSAPLAFGDSVRLDISTGASYTAGSAKNMTVKVGCT